VNFKRSKAAIKETYGPRPMYDFVPWMIQILDDVVMCKDGSALVCFSVDGSEELSLRKQEYINAITTVENNFRKMISNAIVWTTTHRRSSEDLKIIKEQTDEQANIEFDTNSSDVEFTGSYCNKDYISVLFKPDRGLFKLSSRVCVFRGKGASLPIAILKSIGTMLGRRAALGYCVEQLMTQLEQMIPCVDNIEQVLQPIGVKRLKGNSLRVFLHDCCSPVNENENIESSDTWPYLDTTLIRNSVHSYRKYASFVSENVRCCSALTIKTYPGENSSDILHALLNLPCDINITQVVSFQDDDAAKKYSDNQDYYLLDRLLSQNIEIKKRTNEFNKNNKHVYFNFTVIVFGCSKEELRNNLDLVAHCISSCGVIFICEQDAHIISTWAGTLPGQYGEIYRWNFLSAPHFSNLAHMVMNKGAEID